MKHYLFGFFLCLFFTASAQDYITFSGQLKDIQTNETIPSTGVYLFQDSIRYATMTDLDGNFSISVPKGKYKLKISFIGYSDYEQEIDLQKNTVLPIQISPSVQTLKEVVITADRTEKEVESTETGKMELTMEEIEKLPAILENPMR